MAMTSSEFLSRNNLYHSVNLSGFIKKEDKREEKNFLDNLSNYLDNLHESAEHLAQPSIIPERFTETLKYQPNQDSFTLASKLEQSLAKIKEVKLKNHYLEK